MYTRIHIHSYLGRLNISEVYLAGVREVMADNPHGDHKGVKAHFRMDESGVLNLDNVSRRGHDLWELVVACCPYLLHLQSQS